MGLRTLMFLWLVVVAPSSRYSTQFARDTTMQSSEDKHTVEVQKHEADDVVEVEAKAQAAGKNKKRNAETLQKDVGAKAQAAAKVEAGRFPFAIFNEAKSAPFAAGSSPVCDFPESLSPGSEACCAKGTEFDYFLAEAGPGLEPFSIDQDMHNTMLIIIDMQLDFTRGSFSSPCWASSGADLSRRIGQLAIHMAEKGATIVASKDIHPADHCSLVGDHHCRNTKDVASDKRNHQNTSSLKDEISETRYRNTFPGHCQFTPADNRPDGPVELMPSDIPGNPSPGKFPFNGADFDPAIDDALRKISGKNPAQVEIVYKGFHKDYESFSAMPHEWDSTTRTSVGADEVKWTGGYAKKNPVDCPGKTSGFDIPACYPTYAELADPQTEMKSIKTIMNAPWWSKLENADPTITKTITKVVSVGLVYDFCVKETAIFAKELSKVLDRDIESIVLADLSRPSFDGLAGLFKGLYPGVDPAAGTVPNHQNTLKDLRDGEVIVSRAP